MISSSNNDKIKEISKLKDKKYRNMYNKFLIEGKHLVEEAYKNNYLEEVFVLDGYFSDYENTTILSENAMRKISNLSSVPKIIGVSKKLKKGTLKGKVLILDNIKDPGNMGTILRSAAAFSVDTVLISDNSVDIYNDKVIRASEGLIFSLNIIIGDLNYYLDKLKEENYDIYATDVNGGTELGTFKFKEKTAIIMGSEASGVRENIKDKSNKKLYIKMNNNCESLNVGVSASIILYELNK